MIQLKWFLFKSFMIDAKVSWIYLRHSRVIFNVRNTNRCKMIILTFGVSVQSNAKFVYGKALFLVFPFVIQFKCTIRSYIEFISAEFVRPECMFVISIRASDFIIWLKIDRHWPIRKQDLIIFWKKNSSLEIFEITYRNAKYYCKTSIIGVIISYLNNC